MNKKFILKCLFFVILIAAVRVVVDSYSVAIYNDIAIDQMQMNDKSFIALQAYNKSAKNELYYCIIFFMIALLLFKGEIKNLFIKIKEKKHENN